MATTYKVLGQSNPSATTQTTLYTVPASTSAIVSTLTVCNQAASAGTYRIAIQPAGAALTTKHYIAYNVTIPASASDTITLGITLATTDVISVYASSTSFSFSAFGSEIA
jgi:hypothetical protein